MAETAGKRFNRMIHRWWLELDNACHVNPNLYRWGLYLDNACHVNPILYRWWLDLVYVGRLYQADNSKRRVRRLTHQFGTYTDAGLNAAKRQSAQNPCPIRLSAGGGGGVKPPHSTLPPSLSLSSYLKFVTNLASQRLIVLTSLNTTQANGL